MPANTNRKKTELLAPAGTIVSAITAFDAGADAIYAGLKKFNARERSGNFTPDEMSAAISYAHSNGRRVYVTLNTIVKESETEEFARTVSLIAELGADAVIVQDYGAVRIVREYFPGLQIHASTQMAIHNSAGARMAASLGIERVILERQTTFDEMEKIVSRSPIGIEIFIHGALCCSLSGICLLSSWTSGASGNRGNCRQPCRYQYSASDGRKSYLLSTADLCAAENIPRLMKSGICAFKIEGRLKKQDYVKNTVTAYRLLMDAPEKEFPHALMEAKSLLSLTCGRKYIGGFAQKSDFGKLIVSGSPGTMGALCGKVLSTRSDGFQVAAADKIHLGDRLRVQSEKLEKGVILTVREIVVGGKGVPEARPGTSCFIPSTRKVRKGDNVFKIGESISELPRRIAALPKTRRTEIDLHISVTDGGFGVQARIMERTFNFSFPAKLAKADRHPLTREKISAEFASGVPEKFRPGKISAEAGGEFFIPLSELKDVRRTFWKWAEENIGYDPAAEKARQGLDRFLRDYARLKESPPCPPEPICAAANDAGITQEISILARDIHTRPRDSGEIIMPFFCPEDDLEKTRKMVEKAYSDGKRRFRATSLYCLELLKGLKDVSIVSSYPLAAANSMAVCEFRSLGLSQAQIWPELEEDESRQVLQLSVLPLEFFSSGAIPLLVTRGKIDAVGEFSDERGNRFRTVHSPEMGLDIVFPAEPASRPGIPGTSEFRDTKWIR